MQNQGLKCPLCDQQKAVLFFSGEMKEKGWLRPQIYNQCSNCRYIFLQPELRLSPVAERARYTHHQNDLSDEGYCRFLANLWQPVKLRLKPAALGIDYGCGPNPVLASLVRQDGFAIDFYDPYFFPQNLTKNHYNFLLCSEAFEHFYAPAKELSLWQKILTRGSCIGLMTEMWHERNDFAHWYYRRDPTHVGFLTPETVGWIAEQYGWSYQILSTRVILFSKSI